MDVTLTGGVTYTLIIDGWSNFQDEGAYTLTVGTLTTETVSASSLGLNDNGATYTGALADYTCVNAAVASTGTVVSVDDVTFALQDTYCGDFALRLVSPSATELGLMTFPGAAETAGSGTCGGDSTNLATAFPISFYDAAPNDPETMGSTLDTSGVVCEDDGLCDYFPNPGPAEPGTNLADFIGEIANGNWQVCVASGCLSSNTFDAYSLTVTVFGP